MSEHLLPEGASPFPTGNDCEFAKRFAKNALLLPARRGRRALRVGGCGFAGCLLKTAPVLRGRRDAAPYRIPFAVK